MNLNLRQIAELAGVSASTVSRVIHGDPRISETTQKRVHKHLDLSGYELDPIVSSGMSRIRRKDFYRETIAWCSDLPHTSMPWLKPMFASLEDYGARLGYRVEYYHFNNTSVCELSSLGRRWRARGIRGVLLGPFNNHYQSLSFEWDNLAWVSLGRAMEQPILHSVWRDYALDIQKALAWFEQRGYHQIGFMDEPNSPHTSRLPFLHAAMLYRSAIQGNDAQPYCEMDPKKTASVKRWFQAYKPDGLILSNTLKPPLQRAIPIASQLPKLYLSPPSGKDAKDSPYTCARYEIIGQAAVNLVHRLLQTQEFGIPEFRQTLMVESTWHNQ